MRTLSYFRPAYLRILPRQGGIDFREALREKLQEASILTRICSSSLIVKNAPSALLSLEVEPVWYAVAKISSALFSLLVILPVIIVGALGFSLTSLALLLTAAAVGFIIPELYLMDKMAKRRQELRAQFPNFLDILRVYASSAGYDGFAPAMSQIAAGMQGSLGVELRALMRAFPFIGKAALLRIVEERFPFSSCRDLVATIKLEHVYGGGIAEKITVLAEEAQKERLQQAKALGQRSSVALLVPLLLFHFPVALILFIMPFAFSILKALGAN